MSLQDLKQLSQESTEMEAVTRIKSYFDTAKTLDAASQDQISDTMTHLLTTFYETSSERLRCLLCCLFSEAFRLTVPQSAFADHSSTRNFLNFFIETLHCLEGDNSTNLTLCEYFLQNFSLIRIFNIVYTLEDPDDLVLSLFRKIVKLDCDFPQNVKEYVLNILSCLMFECPRYDALFDQFMIWLTPPFKPKNRHHGLLLDVISSCEEFIRFPLQKYCKDLLFVSKPVISVYLVLQELSLISASFVERALIHLDYKLSNCSGKERLQLIRFIGDFFADHSDFVLSGYTSLWKLFLSCFNDEYFEVCKACVEAGVKLFKYEDLRSDLIDELCGFHSDENIRLEVLSAVGTIIKHNVADHRLIDYLVLEIRDKKISVRKKALWTVSKLLVHEMKEGVSLRDCHLSVGVEKMLIHFCQPNVEDKRIAEECLMNLLFSFGEPENLARIFSDIFMRDNENSRTVFINLIRKTQRLRESALRVLESLSEESSESTTSEITTLTKLLSSGQPKTLPIMCKLFAPETVPQGGKNFKLLHDFINMNFPLGVLKKRIKQIASLVDVDESSCSPLSCFFFTFSFGATIKEASGGFIRTVSSTERLLKKISRSYSLSREKVDSLFIELTNSLFNNFPSFFRHEDILSTLSTWVEKGRDPFFHLGLQLLRHICHNIERDFPPQYETIQTLMTKIMFAKSIRITKLSSLILHDSSNQSPLRQLFNDNFGHICPADSDYSHKLTVVGISAQLLPGLAQKHFSSFIEMLTDLFSFPHNSAKPKSKWISLDSMDDVFKSKLIGLSALKRFLLGCQNDGDFLKSEIVLIGFNFLHKCLLLADDSFKFDHECERFLVRTKAATVVIGLCQSYSIYARIPQNVINDVLMLLGSSGGKSSISHRCLEEMKKKIFTKIKLRLDSMKLPIEFMGMFVFPFIGLFPSQLEESKTFLSKYVMKRRQYSSFFEKKLMTCKNASPETIIPYIMHLLSSLDVCSSVEDIEGLMKISRALSLFVGFLVTPDNCNYLIKFVQRIKEYRSAAHMVDDDFNMKMWAVCDITHLQLISKSSNFPLREVNYSYEYMPSKLFVKAREDRFNSQSVFAPLKVRQSILPYLTEELESSDVLRKKSIKVRSTAPPQGDTPVTSTPFRNRAGKSSAEFVRNEEMADVSGSSKRMSI